MTISQLRVLVADDDALIRSSLTSLFAARQDIELVATTSNGAEALRILDTHRVDVALIDADMPILDGVETAALISARFPSVTVVIFTAFEHEDYLPRALAAGALGFLTKDIPISDLVPLLYRAVAGETVLGSRPTSLVTNAYRSQARQQEILSPFVASVESLPPYLREVFDLVAQGVPNTLIAAKLHIGEGTVRTYVNRVLQLTGSQSRADLAIHALKAGLA